MHSRRQKRWMVMATAAWLLLAGAWVPASSAYAQTAPATTSSAGSSSSPGDATCTDFATAAQNAFAPSTASTGTGLLSDIYNFIKAIVATATQNLFSAFTNSSEYQDALGAVFTLVVLFYGISFTMGIVQVSFGDVLKRLLKIGVVTTLISPGGWDFFNNTVVHFFNDGTDQLVEAMITIGTGQTIPSGATPFYQFDQLAQFIIDPQTIKWMIGTLTTLSPFSLSMMALMVMAVGGFVKLLVGALRVYAVSFVARSMLLGLAPIFFTFLLFDRTKPMFTAWLNALINMSLKPVLMFTFLSFFMVLLESSAISMLSVNVCWTPFKNIAGTTNPVSGFRLVDRNNQPITSELDWNGALSCTMKNLTTTAASSTTSAASASSGNCDSFPINVLDILTFLILVYIAQKFSESIGSIADELSQSFTNLEGSAAFASVLGKQGQNIGDFFGKLGK